MNKMRIITVFTAIVVVSIYLMICFIGMKTDNSSSKIKVGFLYDGDESAPYTYNFIKSQNKLDEYYQGKKVETVSRSNIPEDKGEQGLNELIDEGCDIIFSTSYGYEDAAKKLAKEHPEIQFCQATGDNANDKPLSNYHTFMGEIYEGRYVSGIVAGMKLREMINEGIITEEQAKVGYVGAFPYAEVISGYTAFILGVRRIVPKATMEVKYIHTWTSYSLEKKCAQELIDDNCVIISQHTNTIGAAVACEEASENGATVYHVGYNQSMVDVAPTTSLVSSRINWNPYIFGAVEAVLKNKSIEKTVEGHVHGNDVGAGFKHGWVQMLDINGLIAARGTEDAVNETIEKIYNNEITIFKGDYIGVDPQNPEDTIDLKNGFKENENASAPSFHYVLKDVITISE